jgi:NhaA family Na+:H+ antiporter
MIDMAHESQGNGYNLGEFQRFFHSQVSGSIMLLACAIIALVWANSPWSEHYFHILHTKVGVSWADSTHALSLHHWVNDGLMAIFFFVVGLEIKRELVVGELSSIKQAVLPISAALGGMVVPALLYAICNLGGAGAHGWGTPMATDIAFALGILSLFGKRVPITLKVFLTALAIVDDLGAVVVIALFYTEKITLSAVVVAGLFMLLIVGANRLGVRRSGIYLLLMVAVWVAVFASGIHTTVAGTLLALLVPVRAKIGPQVYLDRVKLRLAQLEQSELTRESMIDDHSQLEALGDIYVATDDMRPAGIALERHLHPLTNFIILPLFALFNAGVVINLDTLSAGPLSVALGIIVGLVVGKQLGVMGASYLAVRSGHAELPEGVNWKQLWAASSLAGVGFTMSLFIASLAFRDNEALDSQAKLGVLLASLIAGVLGYWKLSHALPRGEDAQGETPEH